MTAPRETVLEPAVRRALDRASEHLLALQRPDGHWVARFDFYLGGPSVYLVGLHFLGQLGRLGARRERYLRYFLARQSPSGGWSGLPGGPDDVGITIDSYFSCLLLGAPRDDSRLVRARDRILELGGINRAPLVTKFNLAVSGEFPWQVLPCIVPEVVLLPRRPFSLHDFATNARAAFVPLSILSSARAVRRVPAAARVGDLYVEGGPLRVPPGAGALGHALDFFDRLAARYNDHPLGPLRERALAAAERWIVHRIDGEGGFAGLLEAMMYGAMALHSLGHPADGPLVEGLVRSCEGFVWEEDDRTWIQSTSTDLSDTAFTLRALADAGRDVHDPRIARAQAWILERQILDVRGDWSVRRPALLPGGWASQVYNPYYPDVEDTSCAVAALARLAAEGLPAPSDRMQRALEWIAGMQSASGGFAAYEPDLDHPAIQKLGWNDMNGFIDPAAPDVTGRALDALGLGGHERCSGAVARALRYLERTQSRAGSWEGCYGVHHLFGTSFALLGYRAVGEARCSAVTRAAEWLRSVQQSDGGWGEDMESYRDESAWGRGPSTASQTAWALRGLAAAGYGRDHPAVRRGVAFLIDRQAESGEWMEPEFTACAFVGTYFYRCDFFRLYFPVMALGSLFRKRSAQ